MPITQIQNTKTITLALTPANAEDIVPIYTSPNVALGSEVIPGHKLISYNCFVKNLKAYGHIPSIPETPLPDFLPEDTDVTKRRKALEIEWTYPRKQLNLYIGSNSGWQPVGSLSLLNPFGYPYRIYSLLDMFTDNLALEMGSGSSIGVQVKDVNWGYLAANDRLTIHGSYSEESFLHYEYPQTNVYVSGATGTSPNPSPTPTDDSSVSNNSSFGNSSPTGN